MPTILSGTTRYRPLSGRSYIHPSDTNPAELPWLCPNTDWATPVGGALWDCTTSTQLANAIANAADGDRIQVHKGVRYSLNNVTLPQHSNWVYVCVAEKIAGTFSLAPSVYHIGGTKTQGQRVGYGHSFAALGASSPLAQIELTNTSGANNNPILCTALGGGGYWWFEGIEFLMNESLTSGSAVGLINLGMDAAGNVPSSIQNVPSHFNFGHCLIHGTRTGAITFANVRRGIACNASWVGVRDSSIYYIQDDGLEAAGIGGWSSPGAVSSVNSFVSGAAQSILFGGSTPYVAGLVPRNFTTKWCHLWKDVRWFSSQAGQAAAYGCKNHYEHKNASHALIEDCVMEHNSTDGQDGTNILMQNLSDGALTPPSNKIDDITFRNIKVYGGGPLIACIGAASGGPALSAFTEQPSSRWLVSNVLGDQIAGLLVESWGNGTTPPSEYGIYIADSMRDLCVENVTLEAFSGGVQLSPVAGFGDNDAATRLTLRNNVIGHGQLGSFFASGGATGNTCLANNTPGDYAINKNVFYCSNQDPDSAAANPANNAYPSTTGAVGFDANYAAGSPSALGAASAYKGYGTDGADPGADVAGIAAMESAVKSTTLPS